MWETLVSYYYLSIDFASEIFDVVTATKLQQHKQIHKRYGRIENGCVYGLKVLLLQVEYNYIQHEKVLIFLFSYACVLQYECTGE